MWQNYDGKDLGTFPSVLPHNCVKGFHQAVASLSNFCRFGFNENGKVCINSTVLLLDQLYHLGFQN